MNRGQASEMASEIVRESPNLDASSVTSASGRVYPDGRRTSDSGQKTNSDALADSTPQPRHVRLVAESLAKVDPQLHALWAFAKQTGGGMTRLEVDTPAGRVGGSHRGAGVFGPDSLTEADPVLDWPSWQEGQR